jgi:hypothetical protein
MLRYGAPSRAADEFQAVMRESGLSFDFFSSLFQVISHIAYSLLAVPKLFEDEPDLLYQLVTQLSPALFVDRNVPIFKTLQVRQQFVLFALSIEYFTFTCFTLQESGEFVITFPKAFHAGFSHGFNCGEAVNFATEDWLHWGRQVCSLICSFLGWGFF